MQKLHGTLSAPIRGNRTTFSRNSRHSKCRSNIEMTQFVGKASRLQLIWNGAEGGKNGVESSLIDADPALLPLWLSRMTPTYGVFAVCKNHGIPWHCPT